ncbi:hypothetical protein AVEN_58238-1 [Araneus ventricosus]|uniref:Uncharacterized protein n=1 Tax=Araneus ventricosus TaxID=182803 RepID=A0A4Y2JRZ7_ARAVE|nr:hypothetical protein AVEN_58238-1 [Araneus ventricosus]
MKQALFGLSRGGSQAVDHEELSLLPFRLEAQTIRHNNFIEQKKVLLFSLLNIKCIFYQEPRRSAKDLMDEFQCAWCSRRFNLKDGHFCFLKGKPDNEYSESDLDELEKLAERLEAATRNQDCTSDDFGPSSPKIRGHDT